MTDKGIPLSDADKAEIDHFIRRRSIDPAHFTEPFCELTADASRFKDFTDGDPQLMREALANIRGIKERAMEALYGVNWLLQHARDGNNAVVWAKEPLMLLTELVQDMDAIDREIVDHMINGRNAA
ncbi:hypothetical protein [Thiohalobacter thiocyanaticus]|uniref:Uncharacterized protein n=1 Tax=Thiohalobacter thiocyanaticus TaxID=585455 RepID=A0A426QDT8_9GAMM|nr:hypothetical protein [Thiohalobacter thiocyanaticus]RRQ19916.1 hypothetical protein D6C00_14215 [Thiohalobacter thiocyanaticus]